MDDHKSSSHEVELQRCIADCTYFCDNYVKISDPKSNDNGSKQIQLFEYQKRLIEMMEKHRFVIGKKFRQGGFSTTMVAYAVWRCLFKTDESIMFIAKTDRQAIWLACIAERII